MELKGGAYQVIKEEYKDTIYSNILDSASRGIKEINTSYKVRKVTKGGIPVRVPHEITENNILVSQVIVQDVDPEPKFKERLEKQRDESAKRQLAQQQTETAKAEQFRILAQGENDKSSERVQQEKEQITKIIQQETQRRIEEEKKKIAEIALSTAIIEAKRIKELADAKAYENTKLVAAGLTPQERAKLELDKEIAKWDGISKIKFPEQYFGGVGSGNGGTGFLESIIGSRLMDNNTGSTKK